ncbi:MAG: hypothetical protein K0R34_28 [Herbinix sp.]|nr:hypothetical protein [Herbinix sp.]
MKKKNRLYRMCIIIIALTIGLCVSFSYITRLKEPIFLTYCVAASAVPPPETGYQQPILELQYLTNNNDPREVTGISFLEEPDFSFIATENAQYYNNSFSFFSNNAAPTLGETIGQYSLRKVYLYMNNYFIADWQGEVELNNAWVNFSDGSTRKVNLGRILIYSERSQVPGLDMTESSSSNQGVAYTTFRVRESLSNLKVESPMIKEADPVMELTVNSFHYDELEGLNPKRGDSLTVRNVITSSSLEGSYDFYDVRPKLTYTKEDGTKGYTRIYDMTERKYFYGYADVLKYLIEKGGF